MFSRKSGSGRFVARPSSLSALAIQRILIASLCAIAVQIGISLYGSFGREDQFGRHFIEGEVDAILAAVKFDGGSLTLDEKRLAHYFSDWSKDSYGFRILGADGEILAGQNLGIVEANSPLARLPGRIPTQWVTDLGEDSWFHLAGGETRVVSGRPVHVEVVTLGDPSNRRLLALAGVLWSEVWAPLIPIVVLVTVLTAYTLRQVMGPLAAAARAVDRAGLAKVRTIIDVASLPTELADLVVSINRMLERVDGLIKSQNELLSKAAHELKTPLSIMLMEVDKIPNSRANRLAADIVRMSGVVDRLLTIERMDKTRYSRNDEIDLSSIATDCVEQLRPLADQRGSTIVLRHHAPNRFVGERSLVQDAVRNLIENAIKHTPKSTTVTVHCGPGRALSVEDDGEGLGILDVERLFEPFVRGNTAAEGTGLGLAIAKQAALINGGSIDAERSATGGARFVLRFGTPPWGAAGERGVARPAAAGSVFDNNP